MIRTVLADTGPLYAAVDPDDQYHDRAQEQMTNLADAGVSVVIVYPILSEAYSLILYRLGFPSASAWLDDVRAGSAWMNPSPQDYRDATVVVGRYQDQTITLFDATLATVALRLSLPVWTYDHHFDTMRVPVWR
ncbi:type II toxin-antitoxin system VapC family toxin [Thiorhodovibrio frisius]|uniref:Putative nucleic acid-binding protein n=1 Tax=Thiorhodovibrio frisius TaxID=631362 RepID=H8YXU9_9GAMM|nr:putative nucleic acid-binding protein [Thiorhodovibrio frisius]EIC23275.1 putative nucleic acid-binding protein [Thiorhodovibrio frisius]WPL23648.1 putative nucleic acid-binding protein, contains PIN domain [Thiorhodovibrio frisius]